MSKRWFGFFVAMWVIVVVGWGSSVLSTRAGSVDEVLVGCAPVNATPLIAPSEKLGVCVLQAALGDLVDAIADPASLIPAIVSACTQYGVATAEQIWEIIQEAIASQPALAVADAGPSTGLKRLMKVRDAAGKMAGKK